jgi:SPP1 family predicted phage head-tail adaptor
MAKQLQSGDLKWKFKLFHRSELPLPERDEAGQIIARDNLPYCEGYGAKGKQSGTETEILNQENAVGTLLFSIRYRNDVRATDELEMEQDLYDVIDVADGEGFRQWTVLKLKKITK